MFRYVSVMFIRGEMHWTKRLRELFGLKCSFLTESKRNLLRENRSISIFLKGSPFLGKNSRYKLARNSANELGFPIRFYPKKNNIIIKELYEKKNLKIIHILPKLDISSLEFLLRVFSAIHLATERIGSPADCCFHFRYAVNIEGATVFSGCPGGR